MDVNILDGVRSAEQIRKTEGPLRLKTAFHELVQKDKTSAVKLMNAKELPFHLFFLLLPEITELGLYRELNQKGKTAAWLCAKAQKDGRFLSETGDPSAGEEKRAFPVLRWIINTGIAHDGMDESFDAVLDAAAALLITAYHDKAILSDVADLIFSRNRRGAYIHDLVWCFFKANEPGALDHIARRLISHDKEDIDLARELLHLGEDNDPDTAEKQYRTYLSWLRENSAFLYFTGESLQFASSPDPCRVDVEAKYLCGSPSRGRGQAVEVFAHARNPRLERFRTLSDEEKEILASHSRRLFMQNRRSWGKWFELPLERQLESAKDAWEEST